MEDKSEYNEVYDFIINLEDKIIEDKKINDKDLKILLGGTSIGRYSCFFWNEIEFNNTINKNSDKRPFWNWLVIGAADVIGGIAGGTVNFASAISTGGGASNVANTLTNPKNK